MSSAAFEGGLVGLGLRTESGACSTVPQPYPGWPYRALSRRGPGRTQRARSRAAGVTGSVRQPGRTGSGAVRWSGRGGPSSEAACLQSGIGANGVTSLLRSSCCPHANRLWALGGIRNRKKKAIIYQGCHVSALQKEVCRYCCYSCQTRWTCAAGTLHRDQRSALILWVINKISTCSFAFGPCASVPLILSAQTHENPKQIQKILKIY